jgi:hypothetical protein
MITTQRLRRRDFCSCFVTLHSNIGISHAAKHMADDCLTNQNATFLDLLSHPTFKYPASRVPHNKNHLKSHTWPGP